LRRWRADATFTDGAIVSTEGGFRMEREEVLP
jgi:hypothetical protein